MRNAVQVIICSVHRVAQGHALRALVDHKLVSYESSVCTVASADLQNFINGVVIRYNGSS